LLLLINVLDIKCLEKATYLKKQNGLIIGQPSRYCTKMQSISTSAYSKMMVRMRKTRITEKLQICGAESLGWCFVIR
jgi:hypothetical protein